MLNFIDGGVCAAQGFRAAAKKVAVQAGKRPFLYD